MWVPLGVASFADWAVGPRNRASKAPGHDSWCATPCAGEGDHKGRPYDAVAAGDAVGAGRRSPSPIPQGIRPEDNWWERTWKRPRTGDRRGAPCGCPPGSQRSPAGWSGRATGSARHPATTRGVRRRVPGRATARVAPPMRSPQATRLVPGVDHLPRFPRKSGRRSSLEEDLETSTDQGP